MFEKRRNSLRHGDSVGAEHRHAATSRKRRFYRLKAFGMEAEALHRQAASSG